MPVALKIIQKIDHIIVKNLGGLYVIGTERNDSKTSQTIAQKVSNSLKQKTETPFNPDQVNLHPILEDSFPLKIPTQ